jgi:predicted ester cyclase
MAMVQADAARKALVELPRRQPHRLRRYIMVLSQGERFRLKETTKWIHSLNGDPITGKEKSVYRKELGYTVAPEEEDTGAPEDEETKATQETDPRAIDPKELEVEAVVEEPVQRGMPLSYLDGLSQVEFAISTQLVKQDAVIIRWEVNGTHSGRLLGVPPTGANVNVTGITMVKFAEEPRPEGGRRTWATDEWTYWDLPSLMEQLGASA